MKDLSTNYLGLQLKNPIIIGACTQTYSLDKIKEFADHNAGAVVLKSLFEEQILTDLSRNIESYDTGYPGIYDYVREYTRDSAVSEYLTLLKEAKNSVDIPVIASINCVSGDEWVSFAKSIESEGADALEINLSLLPSDTQKTSEDYENVYFDVLDKVGSIISIPIALKMSKYSSSLANLITRLGWTNKVAGFVLFNRYYRPDFNIDKLTVRSAPIFSTPEEISTSLRWIALLSGKVDQDFAASTGVHSSEGVIKQLLAGANAVQVVSAIYKNGPAYIEELLAGLEQWMDEKSFAAIDDFRGKLSNKEGDDASALQRINFMKYYSGIK
jgi:dihydroorotate dehydrogenase (fumarate)